MLNTLLLLFHDVDYAMCCVQGEKSWERLHGWHNLLQGAVMNDTDYACVHPLIVKTLCANYHQLYNDGETMPLDPNGAELGVDFLSMRDTLCSILPRTGGNNIMEVTQDARKEIMNEFARVQWQKNKPPELAAWYTCISFLVHFCA